MIGIARLRLRSCCGGAASWSPSFAWSSRQLAWRWSVLLSCRVKSSASPEMFAWCPNRDSQFRFEMALPAVLETTHSHRTCHFAECIEFCWLEIWTRAPWRYMERLPITTLTPSSSWRSTCPLFRCSGRAVSFRFDKFAISLRIGPCWAAPCLNWDPQRHHPAASWPSTPRWGSTWPCHCQTTTVTFCLLLSF